MWDRTPRDYLMLAGGFLIFGAIGASIPAWVLDGDPLITSVAGLIISVVGTVILDKILYSEHQQAQRENNVVEQSSNGPRQG